MRTGRYVLCMTFLSLAVSCEVLAQRYIDRSGKASFFSSAPMEDIEAHSEQVVTILDSESGQIVSNVLMRSFNFRKALMQEHFNEGYVESHKFPKAIFKGKINNLGDVSLSREGTYTLDIVGEITIHGVSKPVSFRAKSTVRNGVIEAEARFPLRVRDFDIEIPRLVVNNIAEAVDVSVSVALKPM